MANPTCTSVAALIASQPCFGAENLSATQRKSLLIWFKANELSRIGGTNYTNLLGTTLIRDAINFVGQSNYRPDSFNAGSDYEHALLVIAYNSAVSAGAAISTNINTLMASIAPLSKTPEPHLDAILLMLECKLGVHKAYPQ